MPAGIALEVVDAFGNPADSSNATITLALQSGPKGGTFMAMTTTAVNGEAFFSYVALTKAGAYTLKAAVGKVNVNSNSFSVTAPVARAESVSRSQAAKAASLCGTVTLAPTRPSTIPRPTSRGRGCSTM